MAVETSPPEGWDIPLKDFVGQPNARTKDPDSKVPGRNYTWREPFELEDLKKRVEGCDLSGGQPLKSGGRKKR